ncbi:MAG: hypothetical protein ACYSWU_09150, partial [Planctomycetota bacterium]
MTDMVGGGLKLGDPGATMTDRRKTGRGPNPSGHAISGRVSRWANTRRSDRDLPRRARKRLLLRGLPAMVLICLLSGCAVHKGTEHRGPEPRRGQPSTGELSATLQRLPPVSNSVDARSLAATAAPPPAVTLAFRTSPQDAGEKPPGLLPQVSAE